MKQELKSRPTDTKGVPMMTSEEIARELNISPKTVYLYCEPDDIARHMPFRRIGRRFWFILEEVRMWAENKRT